MVMYLVESTMPETGVTRFFGRDNTFIDADKSHRFVQAFAMEYGFHSYYEANFSMNKVPGGQKMVVRANI